MPVVGEGAQLGSLPGPPSAAALDRGLMGPGLHTRRYASPVGLVARGLNGDTKLEFSFFSCKSDVAVLCRVKRAQCHCGRPLQQRGVVAIRTHL